MLGLPGLDALDDDEDIAFGDGDDEAVDDDGEAGVIVIEPGGRRPNRGLLGAIHRQRGREVAQEVEAFVDLLDRGIRPGHQEARATGERHAG